MLVDQIASRIRSFIGERFPSAHRLTLADDEKLLQNGIIDSLGVLDLVSFLEREFAIVVMDEDLVPENFETLERIGRFVAACQDASR